MYMFILVYMYNIYTFAMDVNPDFLGGNIDNQQKIP